MHFGIIDIIASLIGNDMSKDELIDNWMAKKE